jgi:long-chain acyl-CoA synthetase
MKNSSCSQTGIESLQQDLTTGQTENVEPDGKFSWHVNALVHPTDNSTAAVGDAVSDGLLIDQIKEALRRNREFRVSGSTIELVPNSSSQPEDGTAYFQCMTSGTTGHPKSIRRSHASWIRSFENNKIRFDLTQEDGFAVFGRLTHSLALYAILEAAHIGADIHLLSELRPDRQLQELLRQGVTVLYLTPTQLRLLCDSNKHGQSLGAVLHIICGGGTLNEETRSSVEELCPNATLVEFYGASETSFITMSGADTPTGSVGRAYDGVEISICGPDDKPTKDIGEVWVRSPYLFDRYAIGNSPLTRWDNGFVTVGEMGRMDEDGNLHLTGRKDRMVTIADQNVFPEEIEALLLEEPHVRHCIVLPRPDAKRGNILVAVIAGAEDQPLANRLLDRCRKVLGPLKAPRKVMFLEDFPLLNAGKPNIPIIAAWLEKQP